jgi:hypothetical protein
MAYSFQEDSYTLNYLMQLVKRATLFPLPPISSQASLGGCLCRTSFPLPQFTKPIFTMTFSLAVFHALEIIHQRHDLNLFFVVGVESMPAIFNDHSIIIAGRIENSGPA